jgi:5-methylthioadenosine/S-adenosylhomocysteine deaminase
MARAWAFVAVLAVVGTNSVSGQSLTLRGTIVTPEAVVADGVIVMNGATITSVTPFGPQAAATAIDVQGVIFPGLIDLHNHLTWNALPRWTPPHLFADRYEWQETKEYADALATPHADLVKAGYECDLNRYAELKALANGATATVGSINNACIQGLARNLDFLSELTPNEKVGDEPFRNEIFPLEIHSACGEQAVRDTGGTLEACALGVGESTPAAPRAVVAHLGEGVDAAARREFAMFAAHGYLRPGVNIIHGVGLRAGQFQQMTAHGVGLIWSPRSNIELYGTTTDVAAAKSAGVMLALAPDWSPSGSTGMLAELAYIDAHAHDPSFHRPLHEPGTGRDGDDQSGTPRPSR